MPPGHSARPPAGPKHPRCFARCRTGSGHALDGHQQRAFDPQSLENRRHLPGLRLVEASWSITTAWLSSSSTPSPSASPADRLLRQAVRIIARAAGEKYPAAARRSADARPVAFQCPSGDTSSWSIRRPRRGPSSCPLAADSLVHHYDIVKQLLRNPRRSSARSIRRHRPPAVSIVDRQAYHGSERLFCYCFSTRTAVPIARGPPLPTTAIRAPRARARAPCSSAGQPHTRHLAREPHRKPAASRSPRRHGRRAGSARCCGHCHIGPPSAFP